MLLNTSFEDGQGWSFGKTKLQPGYVYDNPHTGYRSVLLGNAYTDRRNYNSYSSVRQRVSLPRGPFLTAYLEFWHYTISDQEPDDYQELVILDARGKTLGVLWRENRNDRQWLMKQVDMTRFLGKSIYVYFNTRNHGEPGRAAMYVDDVSLLLCAPLTAENIASPSGPPAGLTPTPSPVTIPEAVLATTTPVAVATNALTQPEFATAIPASSTTPAPSASAASPSPPSSPATGETEQVATIIFTPTTMPEILATPTPLGADKLVPKQTTSNIWKIIQRALVYAVVAIGLLIVAFLVYRIIMGRKKQKGTP
jgi:hypothetical protein